MKSRINLTQVVGALPKQLSLFDESVGEVPSEVRKGGQVVSFVRAVKAKEAAKVADILRTVRDDVEHLRVK